MKTSSEAEFFQRGHAIARLADANKPLPNERPISFEDLADLLKLLTVSRLEVFRSVRQSPGSITTVAERLHRDRSAVKRDVNQLALAGMVMLETKVLPGHGRMKEIRALAQHFRLQAVLD